MDARFAVLLIALSHSPQATAQQPPAGLLGSMPMPPPRPLVTHIGSDRPDGKMTDGAGSYAGYDPNNPSQPGEMDQGMETYQRQGAPGRLGSYSRANRENGYQKTGN
jgi:hypothetical protein